MGISSVEGPEPWRTEESIRGECLFEVNLVHGVGFQLNNEKLRDPIQTMIVEEIVIKLFSRIKYHGG